MFLTHFPPPQTQVEHKKRDYFIAVFTFLCVSIALTYDGSTTLAEQHILAVIAWTFLIGLLIGECKYVRTQVLIAVAFAGAGEMFASLYMQGYIYRFKNVPLYVPAGHGMVYLTAVALARSGLFLRYARQIALFVVIAGTIWAVWGLSFSAREDVIGAALFCAFLLCLYKGRSPLVYLAAFFITSWLEIVGTSAGTWAWAEIDTASGLAQGNPPSGVAAWYCLVDAVAIGGAAPLLQQWEKLLTSYQAKQLS